MTEREIKQYVLDEQGPCNRSCDDSSMYDMCSIAFRTGNTPMKLLFVPEILGINFYSYNMSIRSFVLLKNLPSSTVYYYSLTERRLKWSSLTLSPGHHNIEICYEIV